MSEKKYRPLSQKSLEQSSIKKLRESMGLLTSRERSTSNLIQSKEKMHNFNPAQTSRRHNLNESNSSSKLYDKLSSTIKKKSAQKEMKNEIPQWNKIVERKIVKQTVLRNADG